MQTWQLQTAKAKLSEVIERAEKEGPQIITRRGIETAVIVPIEHWRRTEAEHKETLLDILKSMPRFDLKIPQRGKLQHRKPLDF